LNKYGFKIRTRGGMTVDNLVVQAPDRAAAESKIRQIYHHCEILECSEAAPTPARAEGLDLESMISLIGRQQDKP
jgi:hypothetical protein